MCGNKRFCPCLCIKQSSCIVLVTSFNYTLCAIFSCVSQKKNGDVVDGTKERYRTGWKEKGWLQNHSLYHRWWFFNFFAYIIKYIYIIRSSNQVVIFILLGLANETFEKVANVGLHVNMILYLLQEYHFDPATGAIIIFLWNALSNFFPIFGAFLSDSWLGRFRVIALGIVIDLVVSQYYYSYNSLLCMLNNLFAV